MVKNRGKMVKNRGERERVRGRPIKDGQQQGRERERETYKRWSTTGERERAQKTT
jgi:hypothetical protein